MNNIQTYNEDCLEKMRSIPNNSIDMILCDLPYGTTKCKWDILIPFDKLWNEYNRVIKNNRAIVLFGQEPFSSFLRISNISDWKYDWYWEKERLTNISQVKKRAGKTVETISVFYKKQCVYNPQMTIYDGKPRTNKVKNGKMGILTDSSEKKVYEYNDNGLRYPTQILRFQRDCLKSNLHPTQKPVALLEYLIKTYSNIGDIILDNCAGSMSTAIACLNSERNGIMIEKDKAYFDIGEKRVLDWRNKNNDSN